MAAPAPLPSVALASSEAVNSGMRLISISSVSMESPILLSRNCRRSPTTYATELVQRLRYLLSARHADMFAPE